VRDNSRRKHPLATTMAKHPAALWTKQSNEAMQLTKLRAAPGRAYKVPPCAPAGPTGGVTASQLIASVRPTRGNVIETTGVS
jgi:hypothetical protein